MASREITPPGEPKPSEISKLSWSEQKKCVVVNFSGTLTYVKVTHHLGNTTEVGEKKDGLKPGEFFSFAITTGSWHLDTWDIYVERAVGWRNWRNGKTCDVSHGDADSEVPVYVLLFKKDDGFSIQLPLSDSCSNNYY